MAIVKPEFDTENEDGTDTPVTLQASDGTPIGNEGDRLKTATSITNTDFTYANLIGLANSLGFLEGESYDKISFEIDNDIGFLIFSLADVLQFEIVLNIVSEGNWNMFKTESEGFMLKEDGFNLLQEDGFALKVQGKLPV